MRKAPKTISTTPDKRTTKSAFIGTQLGTSAKKAVRIKVRCPIPATIKKKPSIILAIFFNFGVWILLLVKNLN